MSKPSSEVKRRYNNKVYTAVTANVPKDLAARFKAKCVADGVSQASVLKKAMEVFLEEKRK